MQKYCRIGLFHHANLMMLQRYFAGATDYIQETGGVSIVDYKASQPSASPITNSVPPWRGEFNAMMVCIGKDEGRTDAEMADWVLSGGVPAVCLGADWCDPRLFSFRVSPRSLAELAYEHLQECGCRSFLYLGYSRSTGALERGEAFQNYSETQGAFAKQYFTDVFLNEGSTFNSALVADKKLQSTLLTLRKPVGVFALNDCYAAAMAALCKHLKMAIPQEVKILGVEDSPFAAAHRPAISSIRSPLELVARVALRTLHTMLISRLSTRPRTDIPALELSPRTSTIGDPELLGDVTEVAKYIAQHACTGLTVTNLIETFDLSRRSFERQYREIYGCSPGEMIQRLKLERAKDLLLRSEIKISTVGTMVGYAETAAFCKFFRQRTGRTPRQFRQSISERYED